MKKKIILAVSALSVAAVIGLTSSKLGVVSADPYYSAEDIRHQIEKIYPGEIKELEVEKKGNQFIYEVEIELDGKKYELEIDGNTGEVLKLEEGKIKLEKGEDSIANNDHQEKPKNDTAKMDEKSEKVVNEEEKSTQAPSPKTAVVPKVDSSSNNSTTNKTTENTVKKNTSTSKTVIGISEAKRIATTHFNGTVIKLELDDDDNRLIYEIEMKNNGQEAEMEIDAYTGQLLVLEIERDDDYEYKVQKSSGQNVIGVEKAKSIALAQFSGKIEYIELDDDDDRPIYKVEIENGDREAEIEIDAYTGKVLDVEIDD